MRHYCTCICQVQLRSSPKQTGSATGMQGALSGALHATHAQVLRRNHGRVARHNDGALNDVA